MLSHTKEETMTQPIEKMLEELQRRIYSTETIRLYLHAVRDFGRHFRKPLEELGPDELRKYQVYLLKKCNLAVGTVVLRVAALRFFFTRTLKRQVPILVSPNLTLNLDRL